MRKIFRGLLIVSFPLIILGYEMSDLDQIPILNRILGSNDETQDNKEIQEKKHENESSQEEVALYADNNIAETAEVASNTLGGPTQQQNESGDAASTNTLNSDQQAPSIRWASVGTHDESAPPSNEFLDENSDYEDSDHFVHISGHHRPSPRSYESDTPAHDGTHSNNDDTRTEEGESIIISDDDRPLAALNQIVRLEADTSLPIRLSSNRLQLHNTLSYEIVTGPKHGHLEGEAPSLFYVPHDLNQTHNDSFTFRITEDNKPHSNDATVTILVRDNAVSSEHIQGISSGLYLHVPNHLVFKDVGPNAFKLNLTINEDVVNSYKTGGYISRADFKQKKLSVDLSSKELIPPYTLSLKWMPNTDSNGGSLLKSSVLELSENQGQLKTVFNSGGNYTHPVNTHTASCNHVAVVVNSDSVITYLNGAAEGQSNSNNDALSGHITLNPNLEYNSYAGKIWDLRVYDYSLDGSEVDQLAEDCTDKLIRKKPTFHYNHISKEEQYEEYICGVYMCLWYTDGMEYLYRNGKSYSVSKEHRESYLSDQDFFYEYNLFRVGMHAHGELGDYYQQGRTDEWLGKERDWPIDARWSKFADIDFNEPANRMDNAYWVHEDFHQYQSPLTSYLGKSSNLGMNFNKFFVEATAEWASDEYSPGVKLDLLAEYTADPHLPLWASNSSYNYMANYQTIYGFGKDNGGHQYGAFILFSYITKNFHSAKFIGDVFNHKDQSKAPARAMYELLSEVGIDMGEVLIDFAARSATWHMPLGNQYKKSEAAARSEARAKDNMKFTAIYSAKCISDQWISLPTGYQPGAWGYQLFRVDDINRAGLYTLAIKPSYSNPEFAEFKAKAVVYTPSTGQRVYYDIDLSDTSIPHSTTVNVNKNDKIYLAVAVTPATQFTGYEQVDYEYKIVRNEDPSGNKDACETDVMPSSPPLILLAGQSNMEGVTDRNLDDAILEHLSEGASNTLESRLEDTLNDWYLHYDGGYADYAYSEPVSALEAKELVNLYHQGFTGSALKSQRHDVWCRYRQQTVELLQGPNCAAVFGPELSLGHSLGNYYTNTTPSLIKVAKGGTTLYEDWLSPSSASGDSSKTVGPQYTVLSSRISELASNPASIHPDCVGTTSSCNWSAFVWFQGENDSFDSDTANAYETNLINLIQDVRSETNRPNLPVVIVGASYWTQTQSYGSTVKAAQQAVANSDPNVVIVKTDDLSRYYHYDTAAHIIMGERIGRALINLLDKP